MNKLLKTLEYNKIINTLSNYAVTKIGKELSSSLVPSFYYEEINTRLKETVEAFNLTIKYTAPSFNAIHDIRLSLKRSEIASMLSSEELLNVADTLRGTLILKKYFENTEENLIFLSDYIDSLYTNISIQEEIYKCIDNTSHISDHASSTLSRIRNQIKSAEANIKEKINSIIRGKSYSKYLQENIVTIRNDRYVIPVKQEFRSNVPGLVHDSSATGSTLFIEPMEIVEANNKIHELYIEEKIEIEKILTTLSALVFTIREGLEISLKSIAYLDFCFAKAKYAIAINGFAPKLNNWGYVNLKKARHPLIDANKVVPIDIYLGKDFSTLVITGPNTGGKTVTLKTVGLITLMAYSGLFIPCAENSEIAVFDNVFAEIGDEQSIEQSLSTFSAHMTNIIKILNNINSNSLVLLDELGSGTDPVEGSALAISILEHLYKNGVKTIASTHYSELKTYALTTDGVKNASCEFDIKTLSPTYKLIIGLPGKSNAFAISEKLGLSKEILNNAQNFLTHEKTEFEKVLSELESEKRLLNKQKEESERYFNEISKLKQEIQDNKLDIENRKKKIIEKAREEAKEILLNAEEVANESIKEIKNAKKLKESAMNQKFNETKGKIKNQLKKNYTEKSHVVDEFKPFNIKIGDYVYIPSLDQEAKILSLPDKDNMLFIQAGIIKTKIHLHKLRELKNKSLDTKSPKVSINIENKSKNILSEINLLGLHVDEALHTLDSYINDALLANLSTIRIVHGKGEGILKKAVHDYLKTHSSIKTFRIGNFGEGDLGVTIAELK